MTNASDELVVLKRDRETSRMYELLYGTVSTPQETQISNQSDMSSNPNRHLDQNNAFVELPSMAKESASELRKLLDQIQTHLRALKALGESVEHWDTIVIYLITLKIDRISHKEWEKSLLGTTMPKMDTFMTFLENRCHILQATILNTQTNYNSNHSNNSKKSNAHSKRQAFTTTNSSDCIVCQGSHKIYACEKFRKLSVPERVEIIKSNISCFNCLNKGHKNDECKWQGCKKCGMKHNTLLHYDKNESHSNQRQETNKTENTNNGENSSSVKVHNAIIPSQILLSTALIDIKNKRGEKRQARIILDNGSQSNFMAKRFADSLGLPFKQINLPVEGLNQLQTRIKESLNTTIFSKQSNYNADLEFLIIPRICDYLPDQFIDKQNVNIPNNIKLADPEFNKPREIDALLGVEMFYELLKNRYVKDERFLSEEEMQVESFYNETTRRDSITGKFIVRLPFNEKRSMLGDSYQIAKRRFETLERKLAQNPDMKIEYDKFMHEYIDLGHMSEMPESAKTEGYFMPNHPILKESSETTKLRVVFDASAKTSTGISLNNCLKVGPTLQQDIFSIILRFRTHQYALTTDIEKMYRQILVDEHDTPYQQLLYRENQNETIKIYRAKTVTYGTASAPYLAIRTLFQLADDIKSEFPKVSNILKRDFYVDDGITGADTINEALNLRDNLITVTQSAGLNLRKWASNEPKLLESLPEGTVSVDLFSKTETQGTLGIKWATLQDVLKYKVINYDESKLTKRKILSNIAKIYDPIGLLGPIIVTTKLLMQCLWKAEIGWDESVPIDIHTRWHNIKSQLNLLNSVEFNRKVIVKNAIQTEIHGFCDASERAYGACIYIRSINDKNKVMTNLLCSKNRVAPLKSISLPKLELCAALLLSRLLKCVRVALCKEIQNVYLWSDSTITLQWIQTQPYLLKTFVANRVSEIRANTMEASWRHVSSKDNPADSLSRGQFPQEFLLNDMWKTGPKWLKEEKNNWPLSQFEKVPLTELKSTITLKVTTDKDFCTQILNKFSTINKLKRVVSYCFRFANNSSKRKTKQIGPLKIVELNQALKVIINLTQIQSFSEEINSLSKSESISQSSNLKALNPFLDNDGLLRVGGRLCNATISYDEKHPIILPKNHYVTELIIENTHKEQLHAGTQATLHAVRSNFWPLSGKSTTRKILKRCIKCFRAKPNEYPYIMENLPRDRVIQARPFLNTGVDYCGPFFIKEKKFRNRGKVKVYAAIFVCFVTKACHLELVTDLTTDAFLASLRRFFARRGKCLNLYSDNATNFVGANRELKSLHEFINSNSFNQKLTDSLSNQGIQWHFSPPRSPHFGGLWEAAVKSFKYHFHRTVGNTLFSYEELYTYVTEIEAILNSRPITPLSSDPKDLNALSPSHFLIGDLLTTLPNQDLSHIQQNRLSSWQHIQFIKQHLWKRWSKEYLHELIVRSKWQLQKSENIKIGTMVILKEDNLPPLSWTLGRITKVHPGSDGIVRVVTVKTKTGVYDRSVKLVAPLPIE
ncbi:uncharacterized protein LOC127288483 [Leptopilina boulardi]|uniref:uncharacterized protein LOC127288483 n=1 Tax=Leptopilina boulardi TaxID=63433 RepID=UPI0021F5F87E|nr:uncharacterized protein LOC127288483 [Leptopilina boulardi]